MRFKYCGFRIIVYHYRYYTNTVVILIEEKVIYQI